MRDEYASQCRHFWRAFEKIVTDFDEDAWIHSGFGVTIPARIACHILQSTRYYIADASTIVDLSGQPFDLVCSEAPEDSLPSSEEILFLTGAVKSKVAVWLRDVDLEAENTRYPWTGKTMHRVVWFLLKHNYFHLGELNALLNDHLRGNAPDHFAHTLGG